MVLSTQEKEVIQKAIEDMDFWNTFYARLTEGYDVAEDNIRRVNGVTGEERQRAYRLQFIVNHYWSQVEMMFDSPEVVFCAQIAVEYNSSFNSTLIMQYGTYHIEDLGQVETGLELVKQSANLLNASANFNLGLYYSNGERVPQDVPKAFELFCLAGNLAATNGDNEVYLNSHYNAALALCRGEGNLPVDLNRAKDLLTPLVEEFNDKDCRRVIQQINQAIG